MSSDARNDNTASKSVGVRRLFLKRAVAAVASMSAAAISRARGGVETGEGAKSTKNCSDTKAPMKDVKGKVAFITGGSSGIGLGIARAFADAGMKVVITYRTESHLKEAMEHFKGVGERIHAIKVDVTDRPSIEAAATETLARFGKVHVLVNNAGVYDRGALSTVSDRDWDWMMSVNVKGVLNGVQVFLPLIQSHGEGGQIMATSSILGLFVYLSDEAVYAASKFAVVGLMESLRMELTRTNVGVSVICPGWTRGRSAWSARLNSISDNDAADLDRQAQDRVDAGLSMDERTCGERVLGGLRNNDLYILTHPEWEQMMQYRHAALMAAVKRNSLPNLQLQSASFKMAQNSIYAAERSRKRCE